MKTSNSIANLAAAMVKVQGQTKIALKETENPFFRKPYADLGSVYDACKEALQSNGFSILQGGGFAPDNTPTLETMLLHSSGEFVQGSMPLAALGDQMKDAQGNKLPQLYPASAQDYAAAVTLMRRVGVVALVNIIADVDDDGNAAGTKEATAARHGNNLPQPVGTSPVPFQPQTRVSTGGGSSLKPGEKVPNCPKCNQPFRLSKYEDADLKCFPFICFCQKPAIKVAR